MYIILFINKIWIVSIINIQQIDICFIVIVNLGKIVSFEITFIKIDCSKIVVFNAFPDISVKNKHFVGILRFLTWMFIYAPWMTISNCLQTKTTKKYRAVWCIVIVFQWNRWFLIFFSICNYRYKQSFSGADFDFFIL